MGFFYLVEIKIEWFIEMYRYRNVGLTTFRIIIFGVIFFLSIEGFSQSSISSLSGLDYFTKLMLKAESYPNWNENKASQNLRYFAEKQIGMPYVAGLLEIPETEQLVCKSDGTDCVLFVENTLAMVFASQKEKDTTQIRNNFLQELTKLRYRDGMINGYPSRLHYFSDWIYEHALKNQNPRFTLLFQDSDLPIMDIPVFMSEHRELYPKLAEDDSMLGEIKKREQWLAENVRIHYVPEEKLDVYEFELQDGDIFAFVSSTKGLDVSHTAIISKNEGSSSNALSFWHASTKNGVERYSNGLAQYLNKMKSITGIVVLRLKI